MGLHRQKPTENTGNRGQHKGTKDTLTAQQLRDAQAVKLAAYDREANAANRTSNE